MTDEDGDRTDLARADQGTELRWVGAEDLNLVLRAPEGKIRIRRIAPVVKRNLAPGCGNRHRPGPTRHRQRSGICVRQRIRRDVRILVNVRRWGRAEWYI